MRSDDPTLSDGQEGVADPDRRLSDLVEEYGAAITHSKAGRTADQRAAGTPSAEPTAPSDGRPVLHAYPPFVVLGAAVVAVVAAILVGGLWIWIVTGIALVSAGGWYALWVWSDQRGVGAGRTTPRA